MPEKFSDEELLKLYNKGLADKVMAVMLNCDGSNICRRRIKLHLPSNVQPQLVSDVEFRYSRNEHLNNSKKDSKKKYSLNKAIIKVKHKKYYRNNVSKVLERTKKYYEEHKNSEHYKKVNIKWKEDNIEKVKEYNKAYNQLDKCKLKKKEYREKNKDWLNILTKEWYYKNKENVLDNQKVKYRTNNPLSEINCLYCNKFFVQKHRHKKYCSDYCRTKNNYQLKLKRDGKK